MGNQEGKLVNPEYALLDYIVENTYDIYGHADSTEGEMRYYKNMRVWNNANDVSSKKGIMYYDFLNDESLLPEGYATKEYPKGLGALALLPEVSYSYTGPSKMLEFANAQRLALNIEVIDDDILKAFYYLWSYFSDFAVFNKMANIGLTKEEFLKCGLQLYNHILKCRDHKTPETIPKYSELYDDKLSRWSKDTSNPIVICLIEIRNSRTYFAFPIVKDGEQDGIKFISMRAYRH
jgi:hypothetical protein